MIQPVVHSSTLPYSTLDCVIETLPSGIILLDAERRIMTANALGRAYLARLTHSKVGELLTQLGRYSLTTVAAIEDLPTKLCNQGTPLASYEITVRTLPPTADRSRWMLVLHETTEPDRVVQAQRQQLVQRNDSRRRLQKQLRASQGQLYKLVSSIVNTGPSGEPDATTPVDPGAQAQEQLLEMSLVNAQLARAVRLKDQFWGHMNHELRTPLSAILLNGELLQRNLFGTLTPKQTQYVQRMVDSTNYLLALINDILDLTRTDAGYTELTIAPGDIRRLCLTSLEMIKEQAHHKRITFSFEWDEQAATLQVDEPRFKQILVNLLTNAVKFTPERGKIGLKVTTDRATNAVYFAVWDTGIGIAEDDIPRLFQRFVKLDTGSFPRTRSTGLGLALVVQLARLHGGNLDISSTLGNGSCFTVGLPWTPPVTAPLADNLSPTASFVHQLSDTAHQLAQALIEQNLCLVIDHQMDDVAEQVQRFAPDLIFLDLTVDDATGWRILPPLVQAAQSQKIPVIVLDDINALTYAKHTGADLCLGKPLKLEQVRTALSTVLPQGAFLRTALLVLPSTTRRPLGRLLVVDELSRTGTVLVDYLFAMGYDVALATTQLSALALAAKLKPHLVLMDLQMPGIDCVTTTQQLRALPDLEELPVLALTALTMPGDQERVWAAGMNGYLSKPFDFGKLLATVERLLPHPGSR